MIRRQKCNRHRRPAASWANEACPNCNSPLCQFATTNHFQKGRPSVTLHITVLALPLCIRWDRCSRRPDPLLIPMLWESRCTALYMCVPASIVCAAVVSRVSRCQSRVQSKGGPTEALPRLTPAPPRRPVGLAVTQSRLSPCPRSVAIGLFVHCRRALREDATHSQNSKPCLLMPSVVPHSQCPAAFMSQGHVRPRLIPDRRCDDTMHASQGSICI